MDMSVVLKASYNGSMTEFAFWMYYTLCSLPLKYIFYVGQHEECCRWMVAFSLDQAHTPQIRWMGVLTIQ